MPPKLNLMKKIKSLFKYNQVFLIYIIGGILFYGNHDYIFPIVIFITPLLVFFSLKKESPKSISLEPVKFILSLFVLLLIASIVNNDFSRSLSYLIALPIMSYMGLWWYKTNSSVLIAITVLTFFFSIIVFPAIFSFSMEKNNSYEVKNFPKIKFLTSSKDTVNFDSKYTILDFWNTKCAICYEKFPYFEHISKKYQSEKIAFYSVNVLLKGETIEQVNKIVDSLDYSYATIYANSVKTISDSLEFNSYPRLIILKRNEIIYNGWLKTENNIFSSNFEKLIKELN